MWKRIRGALIIAAAVSLLAAGGCDTYRKANYAPDAAFVKNPAEDLLFVA